jgi:hypothetical protein
MSNWPLRNEKEDQRKSDCSTVDAVAPVREERNRIGCRDTETEIKSKKDAKDEVGAEKARSIDVVHVTPDKAGENGVDGDGSDENRVVVAVRCEAVKGLTGMEMATE